MVIVVFSFLRYGMTTRSVRMFVEGIMKVEGLEETNCTKLMTGGPDGDLGSNEILRCKEKIVGIVDGSGVLCDPAGLDRKALEAMATDRQMVEHFFKQGGVLSEDGFFISIDDTDVTLPACFDGEVVGSGLDFRNNFHLWNGVQADFFVPCGGRPASVRLT